MDISDRQVIIGIALFGLSLIIMFFIFRADSKKNGSSDN
jgi:hypothetical protein